MIGRFGVQIASIGLLVGAVLAPPASAIPAPLRPEERQILAIAAAAHRQPALPMPGLVSLVARTFLGSPYVAGSLDGPAVAAPDGLEPLVSRLDAFDCVTLVESSVAIARAIAGGNPHWTGFRLELEGLRYRQGRRGGYGSRLHYFSEWLADNERRGNLLDLTASLGGEPDGRRLRFMTSHRDSYVGLADASAFAKVKAAEAALSRTPRFVLPKARVATILPLLQSGDVIAFATDIAGLDVVHTALIERLPGGSVHIIHAPEPGQRVVVSRKSLTEYLAGIKHHVGVMIARPLAPRSKVRSF